MGHSRHAGPPVSTTAQTFPQRRVRIQGYGGAAVVALQDVALQGTRSSLWFDSANKRKPAPPVDRVDEDAARRRGREMSGKYRGLYEYLERRYANTVVITFAQMEDLLGFALPDRARTDREWWTAQVTSTAEPSPSNAWTLTGRTATPNLLARNVVFDRASG